MPINQPKIVQFRRGTTAEHVDLVGAEGELTVDLDKKTLVVHDGSRPGGYPLQRADATFTRQTFIEFKTAIVQNNIAFLGLSTGTNPPTAFGVNTTSGINMAVARFAPTLEQSVSGRFAMPLTWPRTEILCKILWRTEDVDESVTWKLAVGGLHDGMTLESFVFNPFDAVTPPPATTPNELRTSIITIGVDHLDHIVPSGDLYFRLYRGFDSSNFPADFVSFRFDMDYLGV